MQYFKQINVLNGKLSILEPKIYRRQYMLIAFWRLEFDFAKDSTKLHSLSKPQGTNLRNNEMQMGKVEKTLLS